MYLQCIIGTVDDIKAVITFDKLGESSQWAEYEINCSVIFASFIEMCLKMRGNDTIEISDFDNI